MKSTEYCLIEVKSDFMFMNYKTIRVNFMLNPTTYSYMNQCILPHKIVINTYLITFVSSRPKKKVPSNCNNKF